MSAAGYVHCHRNPVIPAKSTATLGVRSHRGRYGMRRVVAVEGHNSGTP
jgi:hypothetical protein